MKIGIFDSGSGGLGVLQELRRELPTTSFIYYGDWARMPYGDKPVEVVLEYSLEIIRSLVAAGVDMIVVACNTAWVSGVSSMKFDVPIFGVVEPTLEYIKATSIGRVGLAATTVTVNSKVYGCMPSVACPRFVPLIESGNLGEELDTAIAEYFGQLLGIGLQAIILGCTHYPIIEDKIKEFLVRAGEGHIQLINPAKHAAIAIASKA